VILGCGQRRLEPYNLPCSFLRFKSLGRLVRSLEPRTLNPRLVQFSGSNSGGLMHPKRGR
jgi:hypothetical protein